jgi:4-amino-4-deoxy-L-arabinose transferase-like glycosyltransferase
MSSSTALEGPAATSLAATGVVDRTVRWFWLLVGGHVVLWTLLPVLTHPNAPMDIVEMLFFGREWQWGYFKHPPLTSWTAEAAYQLCGRHVWGVYLVSQLSVAACFWAVWRLGRELLPPREALLGAMLLEVSWNYTLGSMEYNNNVGLYPYWTLAILFAYWSLTDGRWRYWIATGVALALAMLSKYTAAVLAATMFLYLVVEPTARQWWRRPGPWLTILAGLLVFLPHLAWAASQGFPAINFALARTQGESRLLDHLLCPASFAASQAAILLPTAFVLAALIRKRFALRELNTTERARRRFLLAMVLGPFGLCLALAAMKALWFRTAYGSQLWPYAGLLALYCFRLDGSRPAWRNAWIAWTIVAVALFGVGLVRIVAGPQVQRKPSRVHFNGPRLAADVEGIWRARFNRPLPAAVGEWWLAGNVALYGPSRAHVWGGSDPDLADFGPHYAAWTSDQSLRRTGGVVLWNADRLRGKTPDGVAERFPEFQLLPPLAIPWQTRAPLTPVQVGIAIIPPQAAPNR